MHYIEGTIDVKHKVNLGFFFYSYSIPHKVANCSSSFRVTLPDGARLVHTCVDVETVVLVAETSTAAKPLKHKRN